MNALIVYAHHERKSFNGAMKDVALHELASAGWDVEISDLYAENFQPAASSSDFTAPTGSARFGYVHEQRHAAQSRAYSDDILREQDRLSRAHLVIFQFPVWWYSPPAIVKGWADRVLTHGFAYSDTRLFDDGLLKGKRAMLAVTTGGTEEELLADRAITGRIEEFLRPFSGGVLRFIGMDVEEPFVAFAPESAGLEGRTAILAAYGAHLRRVLRRFE
jgi:putative NADPH-quinone reductase